jgi:hypothetical protein
LLKIVEALNEGADIAELLRKRVATRATDPSAQRCWSAVDAKLREPVLRLHDRELLEWICHSLDWKIVETEQVAVGPVAVRKNFAAPRAFAIFEVHATSDTKKGRQVCTSPPPPLFITEP